MKYQSIYFFMLSFSFSFGAELSKEDSAYVQAFRGYLASRSEAYIEKDALESFINQTRSLVNQAHYDILPGVKLEQLAFGTQVRVGVGLDKKIFYCWFASKPKEMVQYKLHDGNEITSIIAAQDNKTIGTIIKAREYNGHVGSFICLSVFDVSHYQNQIISIKKLYTTKLRETSIISYGQTTVSLTDTHAHISNVLERSKMKQILLRPAMNIEALTPDQKKFLAELYERYLKNCGELSTTPYILARYSSEGKMYTTLPDLIQQWLASFIICI